MFNIGLALNKGIVELQVLLCDLILGSFAEKSKYFLRP